MKFLFYDIQIVLIILYYFKIIVFCYAIVKSAKWESPNAEMSANQKNNVDEHLDFRRVSVEGCTRRTKKKKNKTAPKIAESQTRGCGVDSMGTMDFRF